MQQVLRDVRLALRRLRLAPGFTTFAVISLALGIGVSTAIYSAVRTFFWMPVCLGLGIGVAARLAVRSWVVTDASAVDAYVLGIVPVPFIVAAVIACYLPAARASRVDPNVALRDL